MAHERVEKLAAEPASLTKGTEQVKVERDTLATRICELEAAAATGIGELGIVERAVQPLKGCDTAD